MEENNMKNGIVEALLDAGAKLKKKTYKKWIVFGLIIVIIVTAGSFIVPRLLESQEMKTDIETLSSLTNIVNSDELSTFQAVYNGIAEVKNEENPSQVDYYVSYKAKVNLGFHFNKVKFTSIRDKHIKKITATIPKIEITDINVVFKSMECMFRNDEAETDTVSAQAYQACIADAEKESKKTAEIYNLAEQNAKNIMKALISPFVENQIPDSNIEIVFGGVS